MRILPPFLLALTLLLFCACSAVHTQMEYGTLQITSETGTAVFLETVPAAVFVEVKGPAEFDGLNRSLEHELSLKGLRIIRERAEADLVLRVALSDAGLEEISASQAHPHGGTTAAAVGLGAGIGYISRPGRGVGMVAGGMVGLLGGAVLDLTVNNWVKLGEVQVRADVRIEERPRFRSGGEGASGGKNLLHQTRLVVRARKANLAWEDCAVEVKAALVKGIAAFI
ncbi:MAG: complement resistance protein TraT [Desulfovibrio sp.]|jgi:hypothetical protein|nr:complement resistance protein TraT [Desulfovibrio sp.]